MKLIIDIDEDYFEILKYENRNGNDFKPIKLIANGIPLPKGHGRLIDADTLEYTCNSDECRTIKGCNHCQYSIITEEEIDNAPTIIEADKGE